MHISTLAIKRPVATAMFFLAVSLMGIVSLKQLSVDLLPVLSYPVFAVRTTYPNTAPEEVENFVTRPIEEAVSSVAGIRQLFSTSREGLSLVTIEFAWGTNMDFAALNVREKLDQLRWLFPPQVGRPTIIKLDPSAEPVIVLAVSGSDLVNTKQFAGDVIKRRMEQISGIALASVTGGLEREIHVNVKPELMAALGLTIEQVSSALAKANYSFPGGTIRKGRYRYALRTLGEFANLADIGSVIVDRGKGGSLVRLDQIAEIKDSFKERRGLNRLDGREAVGLLLVKEAGANTVAVAKEVDKILRQLKAEYPDIEITKVYDQAHFISSAILNVVQSILLGGLLAFMVLFFFLHDLRTPLVIGLSVPVSIIAAFVLFHIFRINLNIMSLGGLALGIGLLLDNSIVVLENIFRLKEQNMEPGQAAAKGAEEVSMPLLASTLTTIAVFLPIAYVRGVAGQLFRDQAFAVTFSLLASLLAAVTLLPVLASRFLAKPSVNSVANSSGNLINEKDAPFRFNLFRSIKKAIGISFLLSDKIYNEIFRRYERLLQRALSKPGKTLAVASLLFILAVLLSFTLERELMPPVVSNEMIIDLKLPEGSTLDFVAQQTDSLEFLLKKEPNVLSIFSQIGLARYGAESARGEDVMEKSRIRIKFQQGGDAGAKLIQRIEKELALPGGAEISFHPSANIVNRLFNIGIGDIVVSVIGPDLGILKSVMDKVRKIAVETNGIEEIWSTETGGMPEIRIQINRKKATQFGVSAMQIADMIRDRIQGDVATELNDFDEKIDIRVRPARNNGDLLETLLNSTLHTGSNGIPLRALIDYHINRGPVQIERQNQARQLQLFANIGSGSVSKIVNKMQPQLSALSRPAGYRIKIGGVREEMNHSFRGLLLALILAIALVYMILAAQFESLLHPFIIILSVPMALIGVVFALFITRTSVNVLSLIGVVVLAGIAVNDAIIKISFINRRRREGKALLPAIIEAGHARFRPIIMTSVTTIFGLLPLALALGPGAMVGRPLAIVIIGGLVTSTLLTLVVVPVLYYLIER